jgi:hypothetical protein
MINIDNGVDNLMIGKKKYRILTKMGLKDGAALQKFGEMAQDPKRLTETSDEVVAIVKGLIVKGMHLTRKWYERPVSLKSIDLTDAQAMDILQQITLKVNDAKKG